MAVPWGAYWLDRRQLAHRHQDGVVLGFRATGSPPGLAVHHGRLRRVLSLRRPVRTGPDADVHRPAVAAADRTGLRRLPRRGGEARHRRRVTSGLVWDHHPPPGSAADR